MKAIAPLRERLRIALKIIRGELELSRESNGEANNNSPAFKCMKEHVEAGETRIKASQLLELNQAADELKIARGYIANTKNQKAYAAEVNDLLTNSLKSN